MNRRAFLTALGAVATQQKFGTFTFDDQAGDLPPDQPSFSVSRFPYLQNVRNDRASILWATIEPGIGQVNYSADGVTFRSVTARSLLYSAADTGTLSGYTQYQADLTGLSPSTDYIYSVNVGGQNIAAAGPT